MCHEKSTLVYTINFIAKIVIKLGCSTMLEKW